MKCRGARQQISWKIRRIKINPDNVADAGVNGMHAAISRKNVACCPGNISPRAIVEASTPECTTPRSLNFSSRSDEVLSGNFFPELKINILSRYRCASYFTNYVTGIAVEVLVKKSYMSVCFRHLLRSQSSAPLYSSFAAPPSPDPHPAKLNLVSFTV